MGSQVFQQLETGAAREREVHDYEIGLSVGYCRQCRRGILGLTADFQIRFKRDHAREPFAHQRVVIHEKNSSARFAGLRVGGHAKLMVVCGIGRD